MSERVHSNFERDIFERTRFADSLDEKKRLQEPYNTFVDRVKENAEFEFLEDKSTNQLSTAQISADISNRVYTSKSSKDDKIERRIEMVGN